MKLLIFVAFFYIIYRILRSAFSPGESRIPDERREQQKEIDDIMVQDPYCKVYFPRRQGVSSRINGETLLFCSERCRDLFISARENPIK